MRKTSKYSKEMTNEWTGRIAVVLAEEHEALTIEAIQLRDTTLSGITPQKMAKMLGHLVEMGMVAKSKNRAGRMVYKSLAVMEQEGYNVDAYRFGVNMLDKVGA